MVDDDNIYGALSRCDFKHWTHLSLTMTLWIKCYHYIYRWGNWGPESLSKLVQLHTAQKLNRDGLWNLTPEPVLLTSTLELLIVGARKYKARFSRTEGHFIHYSCVPFFLRAYYVASPFEALVMEADFDIPIEETNWSARKWMSPSLHSECHVWGYRSTGKDA